MRGFKLFGILSAALMLSLGAKVARAQPSPSPLEWPAENKQNRPWTRWWWMGNAVNEKDLTASMEAYRHVGLGGLEITPIYGVAGYEGQFIDYLSPAWMDRLVYTLKEAKAQSLGLDMATGTGWPFGGPWVQAEEASKYVTYETYSLQGGEHLQEPVRAQQEALFRKVGSHVDRLSRATGHEERGISDLKEPIAENDHLQALALDQVRFPKAMPLQTLVAYAEDGDTRILTDAVDEDGRLDWVAPAGNWTLYAVFQGWHGKMVERAAPGGEGYALDYFSNAAVEDYLEHFSEAFEGRDTDGLRAFFNDSYEVDDAQGEADWTPAFFEAFAARRGYDLRQHLPALFGNDTDEHNRRVLTDYRQTVSDLLLGNFTKQWRAWAHARGAVIRNQAHGSPGNILDLYAASDIPEGEGISLLRFKFASSAAHVAGKPLASAEAATWLGEHFLSNLAGVKEAVDRYLLGGINHIVYHGTAYSPEEAPWPGWLFYAAVHFSPTNPLWTDFGTLNKYVTRAQSILQAAAPDNDVLLYQPIFDRYAKRGSSLLVHFDGMEPFEGTTFKADAERLQRRGYAFDFISDRQVQAAKPANETIQTGGAAYRTIVLPEAHLVPLETFEKLVELADQGATIVVHRQLPDGVPGLGSLKDRQAAFQEALSPLRFADAEAPGVQVAHVGAGRLILGDDLEALLSYTDVQREAMVDDRLQFVRRRREGGRDYFIANGSQASVDGWVPLAADAPAGALFDPMTGETGRAKLRTAADGHAEVYLQLAPGESVILRTYSTAVEGRSYTYYRPAGKTQALDGQWDLHFTEGGPERPPDLETRQLASWTKLGGKDAKAFSGTATYTTSFPNPADSTEGDGWMLSLGEVHESARVRLNGADLGTRIGPDYELLVDASQLQEHNVLEVEVSNLMANRIAAMDREQKPWKQFYNVNFPARLRENQGEQGLFDASNWQPRPSGLLGPVTLTPVTYF